MATSFIFDGPEDARVTILLAHGAGAPMDSASMNATTKALADRNKNRYVNTGGIRETEINSVICPPPPLHLNLLRASGQARTRRFFAQVKMDGAA